MVNGHHEKLFRVVERNNYPGWRRIPEKSKLTCPFFAVPENQGFFTAGKNNYGISTRYWILYIWNFRITT
jgi:hypothetical protein